MTQHRYSHTEVKLSTGECPLIRSCKTMLTGPVHCIGACLLPSFHGREQLA